MKKQEFDGLTKAVDLLEAARTRIGGFSNAIQSFVTEAEGVLLGAIDEALAQVSTRLQDSPLEDPVVPTSNWDAATDNIDAHSAEREQLVDYLVNLATSTNTGGKFQDRNYVESLPTSQLRTIVLIMSKVTDLTKRLK